MIGEYSSRPESNASNEIVLMFSPTRVIARSFSTRVPEITIGVPLFNRGADLSLFLKQLISSVSSPFTLLLCDDASSDNTLEIVSAYFRDLKDCGNLVQVQAFAFPFQKFESFLDDFMINMTSTEYFIEIQADMLISEIGFDYKLLTCARKYSDLIAISGRGCHTINEVKEGFLNSLNTPIAQSVTIPKFLLFMFRRILKRALFSVFKVKMGFSSDSVEVDSRVAISINRELFMSTGRAGRIDQLADSNFLDADLADNRIYVGETVMRGPLLIDVFKYKLLNGFDLETFFLGYDEHDLFLRAYQKYGYRVGFIPIGYDSRQEDGSTRRSRSLLTELTIFYNIVLRIGKYGALGRLPVRTINSPEIRYF